MEQNAQLFRNIADDHNSMNEEKYTFYILNKIMDVICETSYRGYYKTSIYLHDIFNTSKTGAECDDNILNLVMNLLIVKGFTVSTINNDYNRTEYLNVSWTK